MLAFLERLAADRLAGKVRLLEEAPAEFSGHELRLRRLAQALEQKSAGADELRRLGPFVLQRLLGASGERRARLKREAGSTRPRSAPFR